jgi:Rrf2 family transcriptional regulator, nitric oxide-sensitive transcriptional repressor
MKLTQFTDYSLRALMYLATNPDSLSTAKEISSAFDISYHHMVKVVHALSKHGYIKTRKGKGGGILLARPAEEINLGDLLSTLEPDLDIVECFSTNSTCIITPACKLKHVLDDARKAFVDELKKHSLANITSNKHELIALIHHDE